MRIAFIVGPFPLISETFIINQITGLLDLGHDVEIFAEWNPLPRYSHCPMHSDVNKYQLLRRAHYFGLPREFFKLHVPRELANRYSSFRLFDLVRRGSFDIVHSHFGPNGILGIGLKQRGIPGKYVTTFYGYDVNSYPKREGKDVYKELFRCGDLFVAGTNFTRERLVELGCDEEKIVILPCCLRMELLTFQARMIRKGERVRILTVGRLVEKKGYEYAIKAMRRITDKHGNVVYTIVGDGPLKSRLKRLVSELQLEHNVEFLGELEDNRLSKVYEQSHIFVLPSVTATDGDKEGLPVVLQEAQALGLPVVSTLHAGIPEGVLDGKSGLLVPEKSVGALAEAIEYIIGHPELWRDMGENGRRHVEARYDAKVLNKTQVDLYSSLLSPTLETQR
jgi:colanic acid/amylovoran biosynthesis glycosyltransferase